MTNERINHAYLTIHAPFTYNCINKHFKIIYNRLYTKIISFNSIDL